MVVTPSDEPVVTVANDGATRTLTLNRPARRNALSEALIAALATALLDADRDPSVALIALTGAGSAFCSGLDLKEMRDAEDASGIAFRSPLHRLERTIHEIVVDTKKPTLAIVNGPAVAGGCELALACDLRIAADDAFFAIPEAQRGMGANFASVLLPQMVPLGIALEWLFTGRRIDVAEATRWGLVNRVAPAAELHDAALAFAREITASAPLSLQRMKLTARKSQGLPLQAGLRLDTGPDPYTSADRGEGIRAFLEHRAPRWRGE